MNWQKIKEHKWFIKTKAVFSQGLSPWEMAMSITLGSIIGVIPLVGVATPAITLLAIYLRLNIPIALFMTYAVSPLHILLFIPFINSGEWIVGAEHLAITFESVKQSFQENFINALGDLAHQLCYGVIGWVVIGIPVAIVIFFMLYYFLKFCKKPKLKL